MYPARGTPAPSPGHVPYTRLNLFRDTRRAVRGTRNTRARIVPVATATLPRRGGAAPYGWRWTGHQLVEDPHEQHVRWLILHMNRQGYSLARIAGELLALNLATREGGQTWPRTNLHRVISTARAIEQQRDTG